MDSPQSSSLTPAMPVEERVRIPNNEPVDPSVPDPQEKQPGHIPIDTTAIDDHLREIPQNPYTNGSGNETRLNLRIPFFPHGFTVSTVLSGKLDEIKDANATIPADDDNGRPVKRALHIEFCNPVYAKTVHTKQVRVGSTRGAMAAFAAEQIKDIVNSIPDFPYTLEQIKVLSIDVRSRGTVQPRLFVNGFVIASQQENDCLGMMVAQDATANE